MPARVKSILLAAALFLLNVYVCRELFGIEYLHHMGSIEGASIGISRYATEHWRDLTWFPLWYDGMPYQNTYPPLLHLGVALVGWLRGFSPAHAHHWVTALAYCLGPVTLYALALRLSGSRWAAFAAGAIYSAVSSSAWLIPAIATDLGSPLNPRRLQALVAYGEGPHVSSLTLLPLGLLFFDLAVARRRASYVLLAAISIGAVVLTNWLAAFAILMLVVSYAVAQNLRDMGRMALIGAAAYCLVMPWAPPSTIAVTQFNAQTLGGDYRQLYQALPLWGAAILILVAGIKLIVRRLETHLQFAILFAFLTTLVTLAYAWGKITIVPQPIRYHLEMEMALALLAAFVAHALLKKRPRWMAAIALGALALALIQPVLKYRRYARDFLISPIDIMTTTEWKTAQWLNQHWSGERVMVTGSTSFWLSAFSDTPEFAGGFEQGATNYMTRVALYTIYTGAAAGAHDAEYSLLWLKALGVQAVGVSGPASGEFYKPFHDPKKFEGVLAPLWRDGDDVIYRVGQPHASLARVIQRTDAVARTPINGIDVDPLRAYVAALDNPAMPRADFCWTSGHSAVITTNLEPEQIVSVQIAWHAGWRASVNGRATPVKRDALGLMSVDPGAAGPCAIDFVFDGGTEMRIAKWLSALTLLLLIAAAAYQQRNYAQQPKNR